MVISRVKEKIATLFLEDPTKEYNILEISKSTKVNYRLAHTETMNLKKEGILSINKKGTMNICKINLSANIPLYAYIESLRTELFQKKQIKIKVVRHELDKISTCYYTALIFGSYAQGREREKSDLDLLFIVPDETDTGKFEGKVQTCLRLLSYHLDINVITEESFREMGRSQGLNIRTEVIKNHIILTGAEAYYRLLEK